MVLAHHAQKRGIHLRGEIRELFRKLVEMPVAKFPSVSHAHIGEIAQGMAILRAENAIHGFSVCHLETHFYRVLRSFRFVQNSVHVAPIGQEPDTRLPVRLLRSKRSGENDTPQPDDEDHRAVQNCVMERVKRA